MFYHFNYASEQIKVTWNINKNHSGNAKGHHFEKKSILIRMPKAWWYKVNIYFFLMRDLKNAVSRNGNSIGLLTNIIS